MYAILVLFSVFTGLRSVDFNLDSINYAYYFDEIDNALRQDNIDLIFFVFEPCFTIYTVLCTFLFEVENIQLFFVLSSIIPTAILLHLFWKKRIDPLLISIFFVTIYYTYNTTFIRQYISLSLFLYFAILMSIKSKFLFRYLITPFWHYSAFFTFPYIFIRYMNLKKTIYCLILFSFIFICLSFLNPLIITLIFDKFSDRLNTLTDTNNVRSFFNIILLFFSFSDSNYKLRKLNIVDYLILFTIFLLYFIPTLSRLNVYITLFIISRKFFINSVKLFEIRLLIIGMCLFSCTYLFINHSLMQ